MTLHKTMQLDFGEDGEVIASTPSLDRGNDRVFPLGAQLANFSRNPVLFYGHNYTEPWALIGKVTDLSVSEDGIRFKPSLRDAVGDNDPMHIVRALWDQRLLRASSIGFLPLQGIDNAAGGKDYTDWELLEISLVPLPANGEALRQAVKAIAEAVTDTAPPATVSLATEDGAEAGDKPAPREDAEGADTDLAHIIEQVLAVLKPLLTED